MSPIPDNNEMYSGPERVLIDRFDQKNETAVNDAERRISLLEKELIETKMELATARSTEDYFIMELFKMKMNTEKILRENEDLRNRLEISTPRDSPDAYYEPLREEPNHQGKVGICRPPSCASGLAFLSSDPNASMDSLSSLVSNLSCDSQCSKESARKPSGMIHRPPSCASGIAFLGGDLNFSIESLTSLASNASRDSRRSRVSISQSSAVVRSNRSAIAEPDGATEANKLSSSTRSSPLTHYLIRYESNEDWDHNSF